MDENQIGEMYVRIEARTAALDQQIARIKSTLPNELSEAGRKAKENLTRELTDAANKAGNALTLGLTAPIIALGKASFDSARKAESLDAALEGVIGSSSKAAEQKKELRKMSDDLAVNYMGLTKASLGVTAAFEGNTKESNYVIKNFSSLASALKVSAPDQERMNINLTQIAGSTRLTGDELREMNSILPTFRNNLKSAFGTADSEQLAKMGITGKQALQALSYEIEHGKLKPNLNTVNSTIVKMENEFNDLKVEAGNAIIPIANTLMKDLIPVLKDGAKFIGNMTQEQKEGALKWAAFAVAIGPVTKGIGLTVDGIKMLVGLKDVTLAFWAAKTGAMAVAEAQALKTAAATGAAANAGNGLGLVGAGSRFGLVGAAAVTAGAAGYVGSQFVRQSEAEQKAKNDLAQERDAQRLQAIKAVQSSSKDSGGWLLKDFIASYSKVTKQNWADQLEIIQKSEYNRAKELLRQSELYLGKQATGQIGPTKSLMTPILGPSKDLMTPGMDDPKKRDEYFRSIGLKTDGNGKIISQGGSKEKLPRVDGGRVQDTEITSDLIKGFAKGLDAPSADHACAWFASKVIGKISEGLTDGKGGKLQVNAAKLRDMILEKGGQLVKAGDALPGALAYRKGSGPSGVHVGVVAGDGTVIDMNGRAGHNKKGVSPLSQWSNFINLPGNRLQEGFTQGNVNERIKAEIEYIEAQKKALAESMQGIRDYFNNLRADKIRKEGGSVLDEVSMRRFGKNFGQLSDENNKFVAQGIALPLQDQRNEEKLADLKKSIREESEAIKKRNLESRANFDANQSMIDGLKIRLAKEKELSNVEIASMEIANSKRFWSESQKKDYLETAEAIDKQVAAEKRAMEYRKRMSEFWDNLSKKVKEYKEVESRGTEEYIRAIREMNDRRSRAFGGNMDQLTGPTALAFAGGNQAHVTPEKIKQAKEYLTELRKIEEMEMFRNGFQEIANSIVLPIRESFGELVRGDFPQFIRSWDSMLNQALSSYRNKFIDQLIQTQLNRGLDGLMRQIFGSAFSGSVSASVGAGGTSPSGSTATHTSSKMSAAPTININVSAPNGQVSGETLDQIALATQRGLSEAYKSLG
jgi:hypothetical protein